MAEGFCEDLPHAPTSYIMAVINFIKVKSYISSFRQKWSNYRLETCNSQGFCII